MAGHLPTGADEVGTSDGRRLHVERLGSGAPTVVFESGMGMSRNTWGLVAPVIAERTTAVVYDRSGLGRSAPTTGPRDLAALVADLVDLLDHLGSGPFVLVGHSWGGPIVRGAAVAVPDRIAGLVLVDQTDETCDLFFSKDNERQVRIMRRLGPVLARTGLLRLVMRRLSADFPEPWRGAMQSEDGTVTSTRAQQAEMEPSIADLRRLRDDPPTLPDVPVTVISGTRSSRLERGRRPELLAAHRARAAALPQGRHVEADRSGHYVPMTEPQLIVDEIARILDATRP